MESTFFSRPIASSATNMPNSTQQIASTPEIEAKIANLHQEIKELQSALPSKKTFLSSLRLSQRKVTSEEKVTAAASQLKLQIEEKSKEASSLQELLQKRQQVLTLYHDASLLTDFTPLLLEVYEENQRQKEINCGEIVLSKQTARDVLQGAYVININGHPYIKDEAVQELSKQVGVKQAENLLCIINQQLIISMIPISTKAINRNPELYNRLKGIDLKPVGATEFAPIFTITQKDGQMKLTAEVKMWIKSRSLEQTIALSTAILTIDNAQNLPTTTCSLVFS